MSNWTHVSAVFRVDDWGILFGGKPFDFDEIFGKEVIWNDDNFHEFCEEMKYASDHQDEYLPLGSEGSLHKSVWTNQDTSAVAKYTVTVWGDLRDHDSIEEIEKWFKDSCAKIKESIRQAVCTISNEQNGNKTIAFRFDEEVKG